MFGVPPQDESVAIVTSTIGIVLVTVVLVGGTTPQVIDKLQLRASQTAAACVSPPPGEPASGGGGDLGGEDGVGGPPVGYPKVRRGADQTRDGNIGICSTFH